MKLLKFFVSTLFLGIIFSFFNFSSFAQYTEPSVLPNWSHDSNSRNSSTTKSGIQLEGSGIGKSSALIANIDGDNTNGKETIVAGSDGFVYAYSSDGNLLWESKTPNSSCGSSNNRLFSSPSAGDLFGDGKIYVIIGYGGFTKDCDGGVVAFNGKDGSILWNFSLIKFAKKEKFREKLHGVFSTPALADTDGDGKLEIGFGSFDRRIYLLNANGTPRWYYIAADTVFSSPAFVKVPNDRNLEMIIGTDISQNKIIKPATPNGGYLYALRTKPLKSKSKQQYFRSPNIVVWKTEFDQVIQSSPVIAEVLESNPGPEIIVGSGCFFPQDSSNKRGKWVNVIRPSDGKILSTLNTSACSSSSVAVGDLDDDGGNDIVTIANGNTKLGGDGSSRLIAWNAKSPETPLWSIIPLDRGRNDSYGGTFSSPLIADIDGNGSLEVIVSNSSGINIYNGKDGTPLTCQDANCQNSPNLVLNTGSGIQSTPAIDDLDDNGELDLVVGNSQSGKGILFGWSNFKDILNSPVGGQESYSVPFGMFRGNARRSGNVGN